MVKRKFIFYLCVCCLLLCPYVCNSLTVLKDKDLDQIIATQGISPGVNLAIDDVVIYYFTDYLIYHDDDGEDYSNYDHLAGKAYGAEIILDDVSINGGRIDAVIPQKIIGRDAHFHLSDSGYINSSSFIYKPFSIDVSEELPRLFWKAQDVNYGGVFIGMPTLDFYIKQFDIANIYTHSTTRSSWNDFFSMGVMQIKDLDIVSLEGIMVIIPGVSNSSSINIALDDVKLFVGMKELVYEDTEGLYNPVNDEYDNFYSDISHSASIPHPARLIFNDLTFDMISVNSIVIDKNSENQLEISSPGDNISSSLIETIRNLQSSTVPQSIIQQGGSAFSINLTSYLSTTTKIYNSQGISGSAAGLFINLPTIEIYCNHVVLGGIEVDDPLYPEDPSDLLVLNDRASFGSMEATDVAIGIFSGYVEVSPK
ncbi:hypothetical protein JCM12298_07780 [Desulfothermus naphthae]